MTKYSTQTPLQFCVEKKNQATVKPCMSAQKQFSDIKVNDFVWLFFPSNEIVFLAYIT